MGVKSLTQACCVYFLPGSASSGHGGGRHEHPAGEEGPVAAGLPHVPLSARVELQREQREGPAGAGGLPHGQSNTSQHNTTLYNTSQFF